jgi:hypothetical protein
MQANSPYGMLKQFDQPIKLWTCIREVLGSNSDWKWGRPNRDFHHVSRYLHKNVGIVPRSCHKRFLPDPYKFIIYNHPTIHF